MDITLFGKVFGSDVPMLLGCRILNLSLIKIMRDMIECYTHTLTHTHIFVW